MNIGRMSNVDTRLSSEASAQAKRIGRQLGEWCWRMLMALPRVFVVALVLAVGYCHLVPGFPLSAAFVIFLMANVVTSPISWLVRRSRGAQVSGFGRSARVRSAS